MGFCEEEGARGTKGCARITNGVRSGDDRLKPIVSMAPSVAQCPTTSSQVGLGCSEPR